ncbi:DNA polymerase III subunit alpha [Candidatus Nitrospira bockiana]
MPSFVHLHAHSEYSPMQGVSSIEALCETARAHGAAMLALTDTNGLYGAIRFLDVARQVGLRPILGAELTAGAHRALLLAKTPDGYANLCRLLSQRHGDPAFSVIPATARSRHGMILVTDDEAALTAWMNESPEDLYVEVSPGDGMAQAVALSRRTGLPMVATNRVHFVRPDGFVVHRLLRAIALNTTLARLPQQACCAPNRWLMPRAALERRLPHLPEALDNTLRIAERCHTDWSFRDTIFPAFRRLRDEDAFALLREKTYAGASRRYPRITDEIRTRLERELRVIHEQRFAHYFLVVEDIVGRVPRTCGRGSVAASVVSYCLGITHVDPIQHRLFFERFLNPGRTDPPDIDIDFPWDERDAVIQQVFEQYGGEQAAMVANHNSLGLRGALREVAKVFGIPAAEIGRISSLVLRRKDFLRFEAVPTAAEWAARIARALQLDAPWPEILRLAVLVQGHLRHLSVHCGGVVIVPNDIQRYVPVEIAAKGVPVIQWEKEQTEEAGLVKIDLLGNRSLAVIRDALAAIERHTGRRLDYAAWDPIHDPATQALICRGDTIGCFYIESPATRLLLKKLWGGMPADRRARADVFDYLVMVSSLVRPASNAFVDDFIRRAHGAAFTHLHERLIPILEDTHGIMVYQEDVTRVAMALAGFSVEDADQLRKVISKKHKARQLRDYYAQFCDGAAQRGVPPSTIARVWEMIMSFAGYSFCKPHSASYAQVSFKCAYLRAHYPAEFLAAVISNQGGFYSTFAYLSEARRMGLTILPPDVNVSDWRYTGAGRCIRVGLMQIKTLTRALADRITAARDAGGPFRSLSDFLERVQPEPAQARLLIKAGACDSIAGELTRPALLWRLYAGRHATADLPVPEDYSEEQKLVHEIETLGLLVSRHPLERYEAQLSRLRRIDACDLPRYVGRSVTLIGWLITEKLAETKDGLPMEFATFEDRTALYDATLFPEVYRRRCHLLVSDRAYVITGLVESQFGTVTVTVRDLQPIEVADRPLRHPLSADLHESGVVW